MIRVCGPVFFVYTTTLAPLAKAPNLVRGITRSHELVEPCGTQTGMRGRWVSAELRRPTPGVTCPKNTHLIDFVDRERLCCTLTVRHQQFQAAVAVKVRGDGPWRSITVIKQRTYQLSTS